MPRPAVADRRRRPNLRALAAAAVVALVAAAAAPAAAQHLPLPELPYAYDALEPVVDEQTMRTHHLKHHAGYLARLNAVLQALRDDPETKPLAKRGVDDLLRHLDLVPERHRAAVRNAGGGFVNHALFWTVMRAPAEEADDTNAPAPGSRVAAALAREFGSFAAFRDEFSGAAASVFGSGWAWLSVDEATGTLAVSTTANQDTPAMMEGVLPVLCLDVWEHAYYLGYRQDRASYIREWWRVVNWDEVEHLYAAATGLPPAPRGDEL